MRQQIRQTNIYNNMCKMILLFFFNIENIFSHVFVYKYYLILTKNTTKTIYIYRVFQKNYIYIIKQTQFLNYVYKINMKI